MDKNPQEDKSAAVSFFFFVQRQSPNQDTFTAEHFRVGFGCISSGTALEPSWPCPALITTCKYQDHVHNVVFFNLYFLTLKWYSCQKTVISLKYVKLYFRNKYFHDTFCICCLLFHDPCWWHNVKAQKAILKWNRFYNGHQINSLYVYSQQAVRA